MFNRVLVANRGEIAVRICRTLRAMGIHSVVVHAEVERTAPHVLAADSAVELEGDPRAGFLDPARLVAAAREAGAEAIHPGYGFLSENPRLAAACEKAGVIFIGPPATVLSRLGDKVLARELATSLDIPVIPGTDKPSSDIEGLLEQAKAIGFPLMVKAAAGGGDKGMRLVKKEKQLARALERATSEAAAAFGDGSIFVERYLQEPRHVEMQIFADQQANVIYLGERECSIQRRNQKIVEETPSPAVDETLRRRLGDAAVRIVREAGYVGAGTVEFLLEESGAWYFLEVNARLQVEHPVTELCTGIDLVEWQLRIAAGEPLPLAQEKVQRRGHAIECRLYAEDPAQHFLPNPGTIRRLIVPDGPGVRFDSGIREGSEVTIHYDPILAKLITFGSDRRQAIARMAEALGQLTVLGVRTPTELLLDIMRSEAFQAGATHTGFLDEHFPKWKPKASRVEEVLLGWLVQELDGGEAAVVPANTRPELPDPFSTLPRFRMGKSR